jgi:glycosyltransferase involved in cell wall biosynthesis/SAM-dependent methyltransferase
MCNSWCIDLARSSLKYWGLKPRVLEVGSLYVNGGVREDTRNFAGEYIGIDMRGGEGVDRILPAEKILEAYGKESFQVVMSTEMLEHARTWQLAVYNMVMALEPNGIFVLTARSPNFPKHEYPDDYWRFSIEDFITAFRPVGEILRLEEDPSGFPGVGMILRKNPEPMSDKDAKDWLTDLENQKIQHIIFGKCNSFEFLEREKTVPKISLVMIVKNETKCLSRCVESVRAIVDEFVIVDTGSTDGTQDIIRKYGKLYEIPFTNYVDTKNAALKLAKTEYILFMDADEVVLAGLEFLKEHALTWTGCVVGKIVEGDENGISNSYFRARLWRNDGTRWFNGPNVHEVLDSGENTIVDHRIAVAHDHSHRTPESYGQKSAEYIKLLNDYLDSHPNDPRALFYLGRTYRDMGDFINAITYYRRYLVLNTNFRDERWQAAYDIAICWKAQGEFDKCLEACNLAEEIDPRRAEVSLMRGRTYYALQEKDNAIEHLKKASEMPIPDDVVLFMNPRSHKELPLEYLVLSYDKNKDYRRAHDSAQELIDITPKPNQRIINNLNWLKKQTYRTIFFMLGNTPEPVYGGMIEKQGVGGVETTYLELPEAMAKRGHSVYVFCRCEKEHVYNNVYFIPYTDIDKYNTWNPDVLITSRWFDPLYIFPNAKKIIWMQDAHFADPNHPDAWQIANAVVCSSRWHRQYIAQRLEDALDANKINIVPLAIRKELFQGKNIKRDRLKVIYSSNPDRGLYILADMWEEISKKVKGIHLTITYGWDGLKTWSPDPAWLQKIENDKARMENWTSKAGNVSLTGRLTKARLAEEMLSSSLCLYPNNFWETFCLTAQETQAAGVPMITTGIGALVTTLSDKGNVIINHSPFSTEYKDEFIKATISLMKDAEKRNALSKECLSYFDQQPSWDKVAEQWENIIYKL